MTAVEVRDVFRVHSTPEGDAAALQGLSLDVREREFVAVLGPSGAGKTSLLRILAGLDRPSAGTVRVFGEDVATLSPRARGAYRARTVGYVEQRYADELDAHRAIVDIVALRLRLDGRRDAFARAHALLDAVGLADRAGARPHELSGGEQQRVAACAALAHRPRLLLADEPTGELDRSAADAVFTLIRDVARSARTTVVVVTHDARVSAFADRAVAIRDGRVSEERDAGGGRRVVVGRGGWIRLPEELLRAAGVRERATVRLDQQAIVVEAGEQIATSEHAGATRTVAHDGRVAVELRKVTKRYGQRVVLDALSANVRRGRLTVVAGPSGSGKTTLLDLIVGLDTPDGGEVVVAGRDIAALDRAARADHRRVHVGYVAQQPELVGFLSASENVALARQFRASDGDAGDALAAVGLSERASQRVERLSTGERLRVAIARAAVGRPDVLVADEPTSRLDEANAHAVAALLRALAHEHDTAVLVASHDPVVVGQADDVIELG